MRKIRKALFFFFYIGLIAGGSLGATEVYLRIFPEKKWSITLDKRIHKHWVSHSYYSKPNFFSPPHLNFLNEGTDDDRRLELIADQTLLPKNRSWFESDFLRDPNVDTRFKVTSNSHGCRGIRDYPREKAPDTKRILLLGTYAAFGLGVNDSETYAARLEQKLNADNSLKYRYEVWNCARQGTTAIMGLALLKKRFHDLDIDFLLIDYGHNDLFTHKDIHLKKSLFSKTPRLKIENKLFWLTNDLSEPVSNIQVVKMMRKFSTRLTHEEKIKSWKKVNREIVRVAQKRKIPLMFVQHSRDHIRKQHYDDLVDESKNVFLFESEQAWVENPLPMDKIREFYNSTTWLSEFDYSLEEVAAHANIYYRQNVMFPNKQGHELIGAYLHREIVRLTTGRDPAKPVKQQLF